MPKPTRDNWSDYDIGYGKPPKATQFPKGRSGNPTGRPRKKPTMADTARKALSSLVRVRDGDKVRLITQFEAVIRKQLEMAMKGDRKAAELVLRTAHLFEDRVSSDPNDAGDGSELTQQMQDQILADFLTLNGLSEASDKDDRDDALS